MKTKILMLILIFSFPIISQNMLPNEIYISTGYNIPQNPSYFSEYWFSAFNLNLGYNYPLNEYIILQAELGANTFLFDEVKYRKPLKEFIERIFNGQNVDENSFIISGGMKQLYLFSLGAKIPFKMITGEKFYPYIYGGGGLTHNRTNDLIISGLRIDFKSETTFHLYSGAGVSYMFSDKLTLTLDGSYYYAKTKNVYDFMIDDNKIPIDLVGSYKERALTYLYFRLGAIYSLSD